MPRNSFLFSLITVAILKLEKHQTLHIQLASFHAGSIIYIEALSIMALKAI